HEWSAGGDNYVSEGDCEYHYFSFNRADGAKTMRTLLKKAHAAGAKVAGPVATADDFDVMPKEDAAGQGYDDTLAEGAEKVARFTPIHCGEYASRPDANHIIEDVIVEGDLVSLFGPSGGGKSFVAIDIGMAIARGVDWNGKETQQGPVVYICCVRIRRRPPCGFCLGVADCVYGYQ
ncbi:MAG: AAA family ATPase, partial [Bryobacteraceae bacterium]